MSTSSACSCLTVGHSVGRPRQFVGLSLARHHRDFSQADSLMLQLLRPHVAATLERLHQLALTRAVLAGLRADDDRRIVLVDAHNVVAWASESADRRSEPAPANVYSQISRSACGESQTPIPNSTPCTSPAPYIRTPQPCDIFD